MKIKFDKRITPIETIEEEPIKKRYWDRWLYLGVLLFFLITFLSWLIYPLIFDSAQGILLQQQYDVKFAHDVRILQYKVEEGEKVKPGDTLFLYERYGDHTQNNNISFTQDSIQLVIGQTNDNKSLIALDAQIEKRRLFLIDLQRRLEFWKSEKVRKEKLVYLNVITPNELANVDRSIDDVTYEIATVKAEYNVLLKERAQLQRKNNQRNALGLRSIGLTQRKEAFIAPVYGKVDRLIIPEKQVVYKEDIVTSIINPDYFVRAYMEMSDLDEFKIGDDVVILLPYGNKKLAGKVDKIYSVSELKNDIVYDNTINDNSKYGIVIEIAPANKNEWTDIQVSNIPVRIRKGIINI